MVRDVLLGCMLASRFVEVRHRRLMTYSRQSRLEGSTQNYDADEF